MNANIKAPDEKRPTPWNPYRVFGMIIIISSVIVGIVLGLNWKGLGKPEWRFKTILLSLFLTVGTLAMGLGWMIFFIPFIKNETLPEQIGSIGPFFAMGCNFGFTFALAWLQNGAYHKYLAQDWEGLRNYKYDFQRATIVGALIATSSMVFGLVISSILS
jgi:hypothetical protein